MKKPKTVKTDRGELTIQIPRDVNSTFELMIVKKYERNIRGIEDTIIQLYSKEMSTRNIESLVEQAYHFQISKDLISNITDKILPEIHIWQNRPLDNIYPIIFIDGSRFKIKEDNIFCNKSVYYVIIGANLEEYKEILGFWVSKSELAKQWLNIFNEIKTRGVEKTALVSCNNLKGISESLLAVFQKSKFKNVLFIKLEIQQNMCFQKIYLNLLKTWKKYINLQVMKMH